MTLFVTIWLLLTSLKRTLPRNNYTPHFDMRHSGEHSTYEIKNPSLLPSYSMTQKKTTPKRRRFKLNKTSSYIPHHSHLASARVRLLVLCSPENQN